MLHKLRISIAFVLLALFSIVLIPIMLIRPMHRHNMGDVCTSLLQFFKYYWAVTIEVESGERLEPKQASVIISNHQDTLDIFFCTRLMRKGTVALIKWEMIYIPFIGQLIYLAGNIMVKRQHKDKAKQALAKAAKKMLDKNLNVLIFPEGSRNWDKPLPFKLGAFKLAIEAQAPIQPVVISHHSRTLNTSRFKTGTVKINCLEPISTVGMTQDDAQTLANACQKLIEHESIELTKRTAGYDGSFTH